MTTWMASAGRRTALGRWPFQLVCLALTLLLADAGSAARAEDEIEFLTGARLSGRVTRIDKQGRQVAFETSLAGRKIERTYPYSRIHAVTYQGQRYVLTPKPDAAPASGSGATGSSASSSRTSGSAAGAADSSETTRRSPADINRLIDDAGRSPPEWFAATPVEHPPGLDLSWPLQPPDKGWNNQKNVGQYIWDIINPNPSRWQSGVRLVHHLMTLHQGQSELLQRDMQTLGTMYFELLQDYPRAAFWLQKSNPDAGKLPGVLLAECYWRLGSKPMALKLLQASRVHPQAIKLLGDMGETETALKLAEALAKAGQPHEAYLLAGDACRLAGRHGQAVSYYEQVLSAPGARNQDYEQRYLGRARDSIQAIRLAEKADVRRVADGTYRDSSPGYSGPVEVEVRVASGRMEAVRVVNHVERQFYSALTETPAQIIRKQSVSGVDTTSRATITSVAIVNATAKALAKGAP
ncbi:MAG: FMN-binding protein [Pirellulaceae bacterium]|nr:FMN-binding protein [Pirellulaceae bacterium]